MTATADIDSPSTDRAARPAPAPRSRYRRFVPLATRRGDNDAYAEKPAHGRYVHVYVERRSQRLVLLPERLLALAKALQ